MKIQILLLMMALCWYCFGANAQCRQDSLFLKQMVSHKELIEGKAYLLEAEEQHSSTEYGKSRFIKSGDTPQFDRRGDLTNVVPYSVFGSKPIVFKGVKTDKVEIEKEKYDCLVLSFLCDGQLYKAMEVGRAQMPPRAYYNLIEADFLKEARTQLVGKTLYIKTAKWDVYDETRMNSNRKLTKTEDATCKYCPVTVTRVENDYDNYYIVLFKKENAGPEYCLGNIGFDYNRFRYFTEYFTFENPKLQYPKMSKERWEQVMTQKITKGFTPEEVIAAYGKSDEQQGEDDNETWIYYNVNGKDYSITFNQGIVDKIVWQSSRYY